MEGKEKAPDYLSLYKDLTSKIIDTMLPNLNLNAAYNIGKNNAQQVFSQYEVAYVVENLRDLDERTAWSRVATLIKNLKMYNYAQVNGGHFNTIASEELLKKVNIAVETNLEGAKKLCDLDEIVKMVLLVTAVLKKIDQNNTPKVLIVNEEVCPVKESTEFNKYEDCNNDYENLDDDFKVEGRPLSPPMASFLQLHDSQKDKKKKQKHKIRSVDAALEKIIGEVDTSMVNAKNISEKITHLKVVDPAAVLNKAQELKDKLEVVKLKCDEFVAKFLDQELMKRIDEVAVKLDRDVKKPDSKQSVRDCKVVESLKETVEMLPLEVETVSKAQSSKETVSKAQSSKETVSEAQSSKETVLKAQSSKETVSKAQSSQETVEMLPHRIETVSKSERSNSVLNIKLPSKLKSLNTTEGSADKTFVIDDRIQPVETTSVTNKPAFKLKAGGFLKIMPRDSKSSVESIYSDMSAGECDVSRIVNKALRKKVNRVHALVESDPGKNTVFCTPCGAEFTVRHLDMSEHIYTAQHLDNLGAFYLDIQTKLLETYPNILETFGLPASALWNDRIFVDPSQKLAFCVCCRLTLQYKGKVIRFHINSKTHITEVSCMKESTRKINLQDERICTFLRGNRIMNIPFDSDTLSCIPCDTELTTALYDVIQHAESAKHQNTLDEYNYKVQKEIIKSNPDLFGFGKRYPLMEKHLRQDKLFVNPVADFAYCGICRKPVILNDVQHNILTHLTVEGHAVNFELSRQFRDTFDEASELVLERQKSKAGTPIAQNKVCDKSAVIKSQPLSLKRRYDESDSISRENLPSHLWYVPLDRWIEKEDVEDASGHCGVSLSEIIKMKDAAFADLQLTVEKTTVKNRYSPPAACLAEKKMIKKQIKRLSLINRLVKCTPNLKCDPCRYLFPNDLNIVTQHVSRVQHIVNLCQFNIKLQRVTIKRFPLVFAQSSPFFMTQTLIEKDTIFIDPARKLIFCGCCAVELKYSRRAIKAHIYTAGHSNRRSIYLSEVSRMPRKDGGENTDETQETPSSVDKGEAESSSLDVEDSLDDNEEAKSSTDNISDEISRSSSISEISEASAVATDGKIVCSTCDIRDIPNQKCFEAHLNGKTHKDNLKLLKDPQSLHAKERKLLSENMICLLYGHVPLVYKCNACKSNMSFSIKSAVNHTKTPEHIKALEEFKTQLKPSSENAASREVSPLVDITHKTNIASSSKQIADAESGNEKHHVFATNSSNIDVLSNDKRKQCTNVESKASNWADKSKKPFERYGMDGRLLKDSINPGYSHIHIFVIKTGNHFRCVDCDYNGIVSIPMAYAHLRSCFHNPVVVEGVQYLKEANYHCIVCSVKLYGIKNVVDHIAHFKHKEKLENYY